MTTWFEPLRPSRRIPSMSMLIDHYRHLLAPKPGRDCRKAIAEIQRQRSEKNEHIQRLRAEEAALFVVQMELERSQQLPPASRSSR
jgi:hypothetical protein